MHSQTLADALHELELPHDDATLRRLTDFEEALYAYNVVKNLTRVPREECWVRHFIDSVLFHDLIPKSATLIDVGSGPGFPAWPLALLRPDLSVTALDSNNKMLDFLRAHPLENLFVELGRAEEMRRDRLFDVVTGRAVAPLPAQLEVSAHLCRMGGWVLPLRTAREADDFSLVEHYHLGLKLQRVAFADLPLGLGARAVPVFQKVHETPSRYPRRWADIVKETR